MNKMQKLENVFIDAWRNGADYIGILIMMPGFEKPELIINHYSNFKSKLAYYKKAYNENLELKANNEIKIIDADWEFGIEGFKNGLIGGKF